METCNQCGTLAMLSIAWGKYTDDQGKQKFWRDLMCAKCKTETGGK